MNNESNTPGGKLKKTVVVLIPILLAVVATVSVAMMVSSRSTPTPEPIPPASEAPSSSDLPVVADPQPDAETYSSGLTFGKSADGRATVLGIGSCADRIVRIPPKTADGTPVTAIGDSAFAGLTAIDEVVLPAGIISIGAYAFKGSSITAANIVGSVMTIGNGAFADCAKLAAISVDGANPMFASRSGVLFDRDMTSLICYPSGRTNISYTIPSSVSEISSMAFSSCAALKNLKYDGNAKEWKAVYVGSGNALLESLKVDTDTSDK